MHRQTGNLKKMFLDNVKVWTLSIYEYGFFNSTTQENFLYLKIIQHSFRINFISIFFAYASKESY